MKSYKLNGKRVLKSLEKKPVTVVLWSDNVDEVTITSTFTGLDSGEGFVCPTGTGTDHFVTEVHFGGGTVEHLPSETWQECSENHQSLLLIVSRGME